MIHIRYKEPRPGLLPESKNTYEVMYMKKGIVRIVVGLILVGLQLLSVVGNLSAGASLPSLFGSGALFAFNLIYFLSYYLIGIIGLILLISGISAYTNN